MLNAACKKWLVLMMLMMAFGPYLRAQQIVTVDSNTEEHVFTHADVQGLEDEGGKFTLDEVRSAAFDRRFKDAKGVYPKNFNNKSYYWYRIKVKLNHVTPNKESLIEFFDQTTDDITAFIPDSDGIYHSTHSGAAFNFNNRLYRHKNFEFRILDRHDGVYTYYFKVRSKEQVNVIIVYRTIDYFIYYALSEYLTYGFFYGMVIIFCLHNLLMFIAVKRLQYLFYVGYILSVGIYEMSVDGIAFQYVWPNSPNWNEYAYGTALFLMSVFALEFTKELLQVKTRSPQLYRLINVVLTARGIYFLLCFFFFKNLFILKFIDVIPLVIAFGTGIHIWRNGFKPARFFVLGYAFLFSGFLLKAATVLGLNYPIVGRILGHYSLSIGFMMEMMLLSFSIGDQVRLLRKEKDAANEETMQLKDSLNRELEEQVRIRTSEVVRQANEIMDQNATIEAQNEELLSINEQLELQAEEISRMNLLLEKDNIQLKTNIAKVTDDRALSKELSFEEFSAKYPDQETCYKFLSELKWTDGYQCSRCANTNYCAGRMPYSRRCTKCTYEESVLQRTIFHNNRIPINKAFYLVYLMYTSKGTISSHQLSEKLDIRQSTCWSYSIKVKKAMQEHKKESRKGGQQGWSRLVIGGS